MTRLNPFRRRSPEQPPQEDKVEVGKKVNYHRQALQNIEMHRATQAQVAGDSLAEEKHLDALVALGEKLTDKEIHFNVFGKFRQKQPPANVAVSIKTILTDTPNPQVG